MLRPNPRRNNMSVNLKKFEVGVKRAISHINFDTKMNNDGDGVILTASITAKKYAGGIYIKMLCYDSGTLHCFATFDEIERTPRVYSMINDFNDNNSWFSAYISPINNKEFLQLHYSVIDTDNTDCAIYNAKRFFELLTDDSIAKRLTPLSQMTF